MKHHRGPNGCWVQMPRGWFCIRFGGHPGPCAMRPKWWNLRGQWLSR